MASIGLRHALYDSRPTPIGEPWIRMPCGPVYDCAQMFADPQVRHRGLVQYASDPELGEVPPIRTPVRIGEDVRVRTVAPKLGQHNAEIFGRLGLSEAEMTRLHAAGVGGLLDSGVTRISRRS